MLRFLPRDVVHVAIGIRNMGFDVVMVNLEFEVRRSGYCSNSQVLRATCMVSKSYECICILFSLEF
jgi:hypothetical protein